MDPKDPLIEELESWLRLRSDLVSQKASTFQQLRAILDQWLPELSGVLKDLDLLWQRRLLEEFPLQQDLAAANTRHLKAACGKLKMRQASLEAVVKVKAALAIAVPQARQEALRMRTRVLLETIGRLSDHIKEVDGKLRAAILKHSRREIFESLPSKGPFVTSTLMVLFSRQCENPALELSCLCGAAPVTVRSGKTCWIKRRKAFDRALSLGMSYFALNAIKAGGWAREYYDSKRAGGKRHFAALRCVQIRWIRIINALLKANQLYDENVHQTNRLSHKRNAA